MANEFGSNVKGESIFSALLLSTEKRENGQYYATFENGPIAVQLLPHDSNQSFLALANVTVELQYRMFSLVTKISWLKVTNRQDKKAVKRAVESEKADVI